MQEIAQTSVYETLTALLFVRFFERSMILVAGLALIYLGYKLFVGGVSGQASLKAKKVMAGLNC